MKKTKNASETPGLSVPRTQTLKLSELNMAAYNPRVMPPEKMRALKAALVKHGMVLNLVVQRRSEQYGLEHVLIGGHQRVKAMRELCAEKGWPEPDALPCIVLDVKDAEAKQLNVSLNNVEGEFDPFKLGEIFTDVFPQMTADDVLASGFEHDQIAEMRRLVLPPDEQVNLVEDELANMPEFARSITLSIEFDTVEARDKAKARLKEMSDESGKKPGAAIMEALRAWDSTRPKSKRKARAA